MKLFINMCLILYVPMKASTLSLISIEDLEIDEDGPPEHLWDNIVPSTEESNLQSIVEGSEQLTEVSQQDLRDNQNILTSGPNLHVRFEGAANQQEIPPDQYIGNILES